MTKGYAVVDESAAIALYKRRTSHLVRHVVSAPDVEYGEGLLTDEDTHMYWRETEGPSNVVTAHRAAVMNQFQLHGQISAENLFFVTSIDSLIGSTFDERLDCRRASDLSGLAPTRRCLVVLSDDGRNFDPKTLWRIQNSVASQHRVVYAFQIRAYEVGLIIDGNIAAFQHDVQISGAMLPLQAMEDRVTPIESLTQSQLATNVPLSTTWIRCGPVRAIVDFCIRTVVQDPYLPRSHVVFGDIMMALAQASSTSVKR